MYTSGETMIVRRHQFPIHGTLVYSIYGKIYKIVESGSATYSSLSSKKKRNC